MKANWTKGLDEKDKEDFKRLMQSSTIVLNRLEKLVREFSEEAGSIPAPTEETHQWPFIAAYKAGQQAAYKKILDLLKE